MVNSKLPPQSGSVDLRQLNPVHKKGPIKFKDLKDSWFYGLRNYLANFRKNKSTK